MSRGIKDLRELICVSRLTVRVSDEEIISDEEESELLKSLEHISISVSNSCQSSASSARVPINQKSPDSGVVTNGGQPHVEEKVIKNEQITAYKSAAAKKKHRRKRKEVNSVPVYHELPRRQPLPPVSRGSSFTSSCPAPSSSSDDSAIVVPNKNPTAQTIRTDFDQMLTYLDGAVTSEWLNKCNTIVGEMTQWCHQLDNFIQFAHFWLSDFPDIQRTEIIKLEYSIIMDHLEFAFAAGMNNRTLKRTDIIQLLDAVFREYPQKMLSPKGSFIFLDYLDTLTSERKDIYRKLLSDVKCSTKVKQHAQWLLAVRALALVSVWSAVVNFYRKLITSSHSRSNFLIPLSTISKTDPNPDRIYHAIRNGYVDVVNYMLKTKKLSTDHCDNHQRSLVFTAVMHNQPEILNYLTKKTKPSCDVNKAADTGNTPLHAAANNGNVMLVTTLLQAKGININPRNPHCEDATPLHLAVLHGHKNVVDVLLVAKADRSLKMGEQTAEDIAKAFGHDDILQVLRHPENVMTS